MKSPKGTTDYLDDSLTSDNTHDPPSHIQRSVFVSEQIQEEIIADLESKFPLSHVVSASRDHNGGVVTSEHGDLKLTIPKGAIKDGDVVTFSIASDLYGPFVLPSKCQADLVSPYYWIGVSGSYDFHKLIQVEFEHFAVVTACDPSHYQLLCCEDDDESYTMRPVGYELDFKVRDDISLCVFKTKHFCSTCLYHGCEDPTVSRVAALYLKPDNFQYLTCFTVEVWFSFHSQLCLNTNRKYYEKKHMELCESHTFETSCDKSSTNRFTLNYSDNFNGWDISHSKSKEIKTREINFHNYYKSAADLKASEKSSLFPPRFVVNVIRKSDCTNELSTEIQISLCDGRKSYETVQFKLYVSLSVSPLWRQNTSLLLDNPAHTCEWNKPELKDLSLYSKQILSEWKVIGLILGIHKHDISVIECNKTEESKKCFEMLKTWLERTVSPCWCHFTQALIEVRLYEAAQEAQKHINTKKSYNSNSLSEVSEVFSDTDKGSMHTEYGSVYLEQPHNGSSPGIDEDFVHTFDENATEPLERLDSGDDSGHKNDGNTLDLEELMIFLKDLPQNKLKIFAARLLCHDVIKDIRRKGEMTIESICKAAFVKEDPEASYLKISVALETAGCVELARDVRACFCNPCS